MKKRSLIILFSVVSLVFSSCKPTIPNSKTETVKIYGNCGMCEEKIEGASNTERLMFADWNPETKMAEITFDTTKISMDSILQRIAAVGYDSDKYTATEETYNDLHECCKYDRKQ